MILYLVIKCGHEGIEELVLPTVDSTEAANKVLSLRKQIVNLQKRRIEILEKHGKDEDGDYLEDEDCLDAWDKMGFPTKLGGTGEITSEEHDLGKYGEPDAYCVMKWDGDKFSCACKELNIETSEPWFF